MLDLDSFLFESYLTKIWQKAKDYQCSVITAYNFSDPTSTNKNNNLKLYSALKLLGYNVNQIVANYVTPDNKKVKVLSFFVQNINTDPNFENTLLKLGLLFKQNFILMIPKDNKNSYLLGTSKGKNSQILYNQVKNLSKDAVSGKAVMLYFNQLNVEGFTFKDIKDVTLEDLIDDPKSKSDETSRKTIGKNVIDFIKNI